MGLDWVGDRFDGGVLRPAIRLTRVAERIDRLPATVTAWHAPEQAAQPSDEAGRRVGIIP